MTEILPLKLIFCTGFKLQYFSHFAQHLYFKYKQETIPVGCVPPAFLILGGGLPVETPQTETPWKEPGTRDRDPPPEGTWDQAARQKVTSYTDHPPPSRGQND